MLSKKIIISLLLLVSYAISPSQAQSPFDINILTAKIEAPETVQIGQSYQLHIAFKVAEDWHINSNKPKEEFLIPTIVQFDSLPGFIIQKITYPGEKLVKFGFSGTPMSVYEGRGKITCDFLFSDDFPQTSAEVKLKLKYQGCNDKTCLPPTDTVFVVKMDIKTGEKKAAVPAPKQSSAIKSKQPEIIDIKGFLPVDGVHPGDTVDVVIVLDIEDGYLVGSGSASPDYLAPMKLIFDKAANFMMEPIVYPPSAKKKFLTDTDTADVHIYEWRVYLKSKVRVAGDIKPGKYSITAKLNFQAYHDTEKPILSELFDQFIERGIEYKKSNRTDLLQYSFGIPINVTPKEVVTSAVNGDIFVKADFSDSELQILKIIEKGIFLALLVFFIGGLLLNATPCVFPVIPITVSYFSAQGEQNRINRFLMALSYVIGIALVFTALGLISGLAGKQWGFLFQNTWFVVIVVMIMLALAASLFGAFEIRIPAALMTRLGQSREGFVGAFIMGLTIGIVIAPCAAGLIVALIILVAKLGIAAKGGILFFFMGLGLGLPYLFLATFTGLLNKLPQSGMWMVWIRKLFAVIMIGVAIYFLLPHAHQIADQQSFYFGILAIFGGLYLGFLDYEPGYTKAFKIGRGIFGILLIIAGVLWVNNASNTESSRLTRPSGINWTYYQGEDIGQYLNSGMPVFIDFYASWCAPCREMDELTFHDAQVVDKAKQFIMLKVDCTNPDSKIKALQERYNARGMPTLVFIDKLGRERKDLRGVEFMGPVEFSEKMSLLIQ